MSFAELCEYRRKDFITTVWDAGLCLNNAFRAARAGQALVLCFLRYSHHKDWFPQGCDLGHHSVIANTLEWYQRRTKMCLYLQLPKQRNWEESSPCSHRNAAEQGTTAAAEGTLPVKTEMVSSFGEADKGNLFPADICCLQWINSICLFTYTLLVFKYKISGSGNKFSEHFEERQQLLYLQLLCQVGFLID